jgi:hypothetical protein
MHEFPALHRGPDRMVVTTRDEQREEKTLFSSTTIVACLSNIRGAKKGLDMQTTFCYPGK